jgi:CheY-like chemotaxis protein
MAYLPFTSAAFAHKCVLMARILVVEDDTDIRELIEHRLKSAGHSTLAVDSPQAALEHLTGGESVDIALLDVGLPGMTGLELLRRIRDDFDSSMPAIFLSARVQDEDIEAGQALGAVYLTKPYVATALIEAIDHLLKPEVQ